MNTILKSAYDLFPFKKQAFLMLRHFYHPPQKLYQRLNFEGPFQVKFGKGQFMLQNYGGYDHVIENEIFWNGLTGGWEKVSLALWIELCKLSNTIFDIGANTGIYSLVAKSVNPRSNVFAFEPIPRISRQLQTNLQLNNFDIQVSTVAVSNHDGTQTIFDESGGHTYTASLNPGFGQNTVGLEVKSTKLSTFIREKDLSAVDLIKIDVESHEYEVLLGMGEYLDIMRPTLLIEILTSDIGTKVDQLLQGKEYYYFAIGEISAPVRVNHLGSGASRNFLICAAERASTLGLRI